MGCSGSKGIDNGSNVHPHQQYGAQPAYGVPQQMIPPSTLPQGWISQYDPSKQRLYYVYPQTGHVTWAHPLGPAADAQENARFYEMQKQQQTQFHNSPNQGNFADSYNRQGGMGAGAGLAMGMLAGGAVGLMAGSMLAGGMNHGYGGSDVVPAQVGGGGGDFSSADMSGADFGGGDFSGGDFGGGDFGF
ncbi:hypothetical protein CPC16_002529 [Podila verticillata]|nr:hypothetical protein BGZ52_009836 [Haplosporangium bisporale]KAF9207711.1 hypothetical protein BGZ59_010995 [Podila verticillata]KAF9372254.1 hypothetical protein CPC16_002529 [Podila verticillata]KFH71844.1 hypothetical protein MVEG_02138 [Podila verticillata NRRL 6337]